MRKWGFTREEMAAHLCRMTRTDHRKADEGHDQVHLVGQRLQPGNLEDMFPSLLVPLWR